MALTGTATAETLAQRIVPRRGILSNEWIFQLFLVLTGSWFVALCAQIRIPLPFTDIPITGQTLGVVLVGSLLGSRLGVISLLVYLAQGAIGLPFFQGGNAGLQYLTIAPSAGYLFSYPIAAALVGWLAERGWDRKVPTTLAAMVLGNIVIYAIGVAWLSGFPIVGQSEPRGIAAAIATGMLPFLIGDGIKIAIASGVLPGAWKLLGSEKARS